MALDELLHADCLEKIELGLWMNKKVVGF